MTKLLKNSGLKQTACRQAILEVLTKSNQPIAADAIYQKLKRQYDLVTIYRNLATFEAKRIIFKEVIKKVDCYYLDKQEHHHIVCDKCGKTECIPCTHEKLKIKNFINIKHQLVLSGICQQCFKS